MRKSHYYLLVVALTAHLVILGLDLPSRWTGLANFVYAPVSAVLLYGITGRGRDLWMMLGLAGAAAVLDLLVPWHGSTLALNLLKIALWCAAPAFLASRLFVTIYFANPVGHHELAGAVSIYLLVAYLFANLFEAAYLLDPSTLHFGENFAGQSTGFADILYFSFVTLATLGYGDVAPAHTVTRAIAVIEAVVGLLFMAILIARFVSLLSTQHANRSE